MVNIPYGGEAGMASFNTDSYVGTMDLFGGDSPDAVTMNFTALNSSADLVVGSVVGLDSGSKIVMAKTSATAVLPIGVMTATLKTGATDLSVQAFTQGCFNIDKLIWHADYDTDAKKLAAFNGVTDQRVNIKLIKQDYVGITSNPFP